MRLVVSVPYRSLHSTVAACSRLPISPIPLPSPIASPSGPNRGTAVTQPSLEHMVAARPAHGAALRSPRARDIRRGPDAGAAPGAPRNPSQPQPEA